MFFISALWMTPYIIIKKHKELIDAWKNYKKYSFIIGIGSILTYLIILFVYQIANVSYVIALREFSVAIGAVLGIKYLDEKFTIKKLIGITLIVLGIIAIKIA